MRIENENKDSEELTTMNELFDYNPFAKNENEYLTSLSKYITHVTQLITIYQTNFSTINEKKDSEIKELIVKLSYKLGSYFSLSFYSDNELAKQYLEYADNLLEVTETSDPNIKDLKCSINAYLALVWLSCDKDKAIKFLNIALKHSPIKAQETGANTIMALSIKAYVKGHIEGKYIEAINLYQKAIKINNKTKTPSNEPKYKRDLGIGQAYYHYGDY